MVTISAPVLTDPDSVSDWPFAIASALVTLIPLTVPILFETLPKVAVLAMPSALVSTPVVNVPDDCITAGAEMSTVPPGANDSRCPRRPASGHRPRSDDRRSR